MRVVVSGSEGGISDPAGPGARSAALLDLGTPGISGLRAGPAEVAPGRDEASGSKEGGVAPGNSGTGAAESWAKAAAAPRHINQAAIAKERAI